MIQIQTNCDKVARGELTWDRAKTSQLRILASILAQGLLWVHHV